MGVVSLLPIGTEPPGTSWRVVRYAEDWAAARHAATVFDPTRQVLELVPLTAAAAEPYADIDEAAAAPGSLERLLIDVAGDSPPPAPPAARASDPRIYEARDESGTLYRSDPTRDQVLWRRTCDAELAPIPGFGGRGSATGRLRGPRGLSVDARGFLYVTDPGNHRVQVLRPEGGEVVVVLGARDAYGGPVAGVAAGAMTEPVAVAASMRSGWIFVVDRAVAAVHVFSASFAYLHTCYPRPALAPPEHAPDLTAVTVLPDESLTVTDEAWPRALHVDPCGVLLPEVAHHSIGTRGRFATRGAVLIGPIDGDVYDARWHEIRVDVDLPAGATLEVRTFASNERDAPALDRLAPALPHMVAMPARGEESRDGEYARPVLSDWTGWEQWRDSGTDAPPPRGTDRGRYVWVSLCLRGDGRVTPSVRSLRAMLERPSLLRWLPALYGRRDDGLDPSGAVFLERYLAMLYGVLQGAELRYERFAERLDPDASPPEWLAWQASWLGLVFDPSWPIEKRRRLVLEAASLYRRRGTPGALARYVEIYTGQAPAIVEGFSLRLPPVGPTLGEALLGDAALIPAPDDACEDGARGDPASSAPIDPDALAHHFTVYAFADRALDAEVAEGVVRRIVDGERPAHTSYEVRLVYADARAGLQSTVGLDLVIGDAGLPCIVLRGEVEPGPILGDDLVLDDGRFHRMPRGIVLDDLGPALDRSFELA